jgi:DNA-binding NarL/FixJ family response regulator
MIKIILAEDHHIVRNGIRSLLELEKDMLIAGEAANGRECVTMLKNGTVADIILADLHMPELSGVELISTLQQSAPACKVIVLSALDQEKYIVQAFRAGASGYLLKSVSAEELTFAVRHVNAGFQYVCTALTARLLNRLLLVPEAVHSGITEGLDFSGREIEILELIAGGYTNQEIADKLFTGKRTVEGHRQGLIDKTGSRNTAALIRFTLVNGIIN